MRRLLSTTVGARPASTRLKAAFVKVPAAGSRPIQDVMRVKLGHTAAAADEDATPRTAETWRAGFDESLGQLQQHRSWGRSQGVFDSMSALPGDFVSAPWRAAAAHNAGCAALRLGQYEEAAKLYERALRLRSDETSDAFASVAAVSNLGVGVCLLAQHALLVPKAAAAVAGTSTAAEHLIAAHEAATRGAGGDAPSSAEARAGLASMRTTTSYYAALSLLCTLGSSSGDGRVRAQDAQECIERVRLMLGENARSSLGAERASQLLDDVNSVYGPSMSGAVAEALSAGDGGRLVPWPRLAVTRAHFGCVVPLVALHADGTPVIEAAVVRTDDARAEPRRKERPVRAEPCIIGSPSDLGKMLRECCAERGKPLLAVTGSGLSRACGLPTRQELWSTEAFDRDLDVTAWGKNAHPDRLWRLVHDFYQQVDFAPVPTNGHRALDRMVDQVRGGVVITQNVDGLHHASVVHEVHGSLLRFRCDHCGDVQDTVTLVETREGTTGRLVEVSAMEFYETYVPKLLDRSGAVGYRTACRSCLTESDTEGRIRPDVVLFGEGARIPASFLASKNTAATTNFGAIVVVGTAGDVYPSSAIAQHVAQRCACPVAVVDPATTRLMEGSRCDMAVLGSAEQVLGEVAAEYLR